MSSNCYLAYVYIFLWTMEKNVVIQWLILVLWRRFLEQLTSLKPFLGYPELPPKTSSRLGSAILKWIASIVDGEYYYPRFYIISYTAIDNYVTHFAEVFLWCEITLYQFGRNAVRRTNHRLPTHNIRSRKRFPSGFFYQSLSYGFKEKDKRAGSQRRAKIEQLPPEAWTSGRRRARLEYFLRLCSLIESRMLGLIDGDYLLSV